VDPGSFVVRIVNLPGFPLSLQKQNERLGLVKVKIRLIISLNPSLNKYIQTLLKKGFEMEINNFFYKELQPCP